MNPWSLEDSVVGRIDVKDAELCDNVVWIRSDRERDCPGECASLPSNP